MKKRLFLSLFTFAGFCAVNAQSYSGYIPDNYAGVQGVLYNPASIVDSRFKADINLFSVSSTVANDLYGVKIFDVFKKGYDFDLEAKKNFSTANKGMTNVDAMGPSFMFNLKPNHSLALFTRARAFVNVVDINGQIINELSKTNQSSFDYALGSPNAVGNSWGELGISYATILYQKGQHFLKGGITAKYLQGVANYHFQGTNINLKYQENLLLPQNSTYETRGTATYGSSQDFANNSELEINSKSMGFGVDLGLVYEWRPDYMADRADINDLKEVNKYKVRFGLSVTDIGSMKFDKGIRNSYNLNKTINQSNYDSSDNFDEFIKNNYPATAINGDVKSSLPTAVHADVDWNIDSKFYLNLNADLGVVDNTKLNQSSIANRVSLTPRYETKWFSAYVPVSYMQYSEQVQLGLGLRTGVFFIGSSTILSNTVSKNSKGADIHMGVKIPLYYQKAKDQDEDGILDKDDACPTVAGPIENKGCPWGDKDNDMVLDNVDKCPTTAGPAENNGCPWEDKDSDGVLDKDDKCPTVVGPVDNSGCPYIDTDGDGVLDKDDNCPTVAGTKSNKGCPEVTTQIIKVLNDYSKSILFDSSKATIRPESTDKLEGIVKVMKEFNYANFKLEGYTDSTGSVAKNLQLSKDRAAAIRTYLISKGISSERITTEGYGIAKPIASNKTAAGRTQNRRVEILLVQ